MKRRAYREETYWGKPVPGFGDPAARLLVVGLAPGAHGSNRTGRMFTGDASGDFLYAALHRLGLSSSPRSVSPGDGLVLHRVFITAVARCAPPGNKPAPEEISRCRPFLHKEIRLLRDVRAVLALGAIAWHGFGLALRELGWSSSAPPAFRHGLLWRPSSLSPVLVASYHPSRQNTQTGRLTVAMFDEVLRAAWDAAMERGRRRD